MSPLSARVSVSHQFLERLAQSRLHGSAYPSIRRLRCRVRKGRAILRGRVPTFYEKQVAQEAVAAVDGVREVVNRVQVP